MKYLLLLFYFISPPCFSQQNNTFSTNAIRKAGLKGNVKSVESFSDDDKLISRVIYNASGYIEQIEIDNVITDDKIENFEDYYFPIRMVEEPDIVFPFGKPKSVFCLTPRIVNETFSGLLQYEGNYPSKVNYSYDETGKISSIVCSYGYSNHSYEQVKIIFNYGNNGMLDSKNIYGIKNNHYFYNKDLTEELIGKIKYSWVQGKLSKEFIYDKKGQLILNFKISNIGSIQSIEVFSDRYNGIFKITSDKIGNITKVNYDPIDRLSYIPQLDECCYQKDYTFRNGNIIAINTTFQKKDTWRVFVTHTNNFKILRDKSGNILRIDEGLSNKFNREWTYKYDENDNWIERTEYEVHNNDIKVIKELAIIKRNISYY